MKAETNGMKILNKESQIREVEITLEITLRKAVMTLDGAIDGIEGYYNPQYRWNGAVVPLFTYENACKVAERYKAVSGNSMYWLPTSDVFVEMDRQTLEITEYKHEVGLTEEGRHLVLYPIGGCSWMWALKEVD